MRIAALVFLAALALAQDKQSDEYVRRVKRIDTLLDLLGDRDVAVRKMAVDELVEMGSDAIPFVERKLQDKGALILHTLIHDIQDHTEKEMIREAAKIEPAEPELKWYAQLADKVKASDQAASEKYVAGKLFEAYALVLKENYDVAEGMLSALHTLEPKSMYADKVQQLRKYCETKVIAGKFLRATAEMKPTRAIAGKPVTFTVRLQNLWKNPLTLSFPENGKGVLIVTIQGTALEYNGSARGIQRDEVFELDNPLSIGVGQTWSHDMTLNTGTDFEGLDNIRIYSIAARVSPRKIDTGETPLYKSIHWPTVTLRVVHEKYAPHLEDPLKSLGEVLDSKGLDNKGKGSLNEGFVCAMLVDEDKKPAAVALLMGALEKAEKPEGVLTITHMLVQVTGLRLGDKREAWLQWWKKRQVEK